MKFYGIEIENNNPFWDEVKLRAMNNYGEFCEDNIDFAVEALTEELRIFLQKSKEAKLLKKEIKEMSA